MAHRNPSRLALALLPALLISAAFGCTSEVVSGDGQGGNGGQGGGAVCAKYLGEGCTPGTQVSCNVGDGGSTAVNTGSALCQVLPNEPCTTTLGTCLYQDTTSSTSVGTPLVLSFDGAPVEYLADRDHAFDINGARSVVTDWPTARTPWLALDRDGNGSIDDGADLFGSMTVLSGGDRAPNGFAALRELDADGDGRITPSDPGFSRLLVWSDRDGDRRSTAGELAPAAAWELLSIDLGYTVDRRCDARGNCEVERASFRYRDSAGVERTGAIVDVHFASQR